MANERRRRMGTGLTEQEYRAALTPKPPEPIPVVYSYDKVPLEIEATLEMAEPLEYSKWQLQYFGITFRPLKADEPSAFYRLLGRLLLGFNWVKA